MSRTVDDAKAPHEEATGEKAPDDGRGRVVNEITAILVSWKDAGEVEAAVSSLIASAAGLPPGGPRMSVVVVDNGNGLASRRARAEVWRNVSVSVLENAANRGFGPAANQGARAARGDVLLFLNPDTRAEANPFWEIARAFRENPGAVAVAPRLIDFDGACPSGGRLAPPDREDQRTFQLRRLPDLLCDARQLLLIDHLLPDNPARRRERYAERDRETPFAVEQAAGAALAVRREDFLRVGGFDERFFPAWFEDVDLCARLGKAGTILFWPSARFRHRGKVSSAALGYSRFLPIYYRNALRYRERYSSPARAAYRALLAAGMLLRLVALPLRPTVPRPRGEAAMAYLKSLAVAVGWTPPASRLPPSGAS